MKSLLPLLLVASPLLAQTNPDLPDPSSLTREYLRELAARKPGQKKFVVKNRVWQQQQQRQQQQQQQQESQDGTREIQESDVFKLGNESKKELFLLNNYRGFQVVSFEDGLAKPKLIARLPIYNNWSSEMYYLEGQEKVVVLNTEWNYKQTGSQWGSYQTKLYLLDVKDSENPTVVTEVSLTGYLSESRMVGDVLYTITNDGSSEQKVKITSVKLGYGTMETIDEMDVHETNRWVRTMNVVKDNEKYYVISTLSNWNQQGDIVAVHDITSPNGKIKKTMMAKARGTIAERSQTFLHKGHLFAVSNYTENNSPMRVSVEAFPLVSYETLMTSKPHMRVSVGDTNGLHASLQDVRVSGDHLYAFWVPQNQVDPFELFDISNPEKGIKHLGQLQFDGWISKAFPVSYKGKKYVVGLGWVVPVTSENNRRLPQAKLFEIKEEDGKVTHEVVSSLTIQDEEIWSSLNSEDKYFEIIPGGEGKMNIMFPVTFWKDWKSGAKLVSLDLNDLSLSEGANVVGQHGWLKRVFTNPQVSGLHAFSNERLENFNMGEVVGSGIAETVSVLELARNILSFHAISDSEGVQIVGTHDGMEVRRVSLSDVDAEKTEVKSIQKLPGQHSWHKVKDGKLLAITSFYKDYKLQSAKFHQLDLGTGEKVSMEIPLQMKDSQYYYLNVRNISSDHEELFTIGNEMFRYHNGGLIKLNVEESCQYFFNNDNGNLSLQSLGRDILAFNSFKLKLEPWAEDTGVEKSAYYMPFFKILNFENEKVSCSESVNVPGKPVLQDRDFIVTSQDQDDWYDYYHYGQEGFKHCMLPVKYEESARTMSLKLVNNEAELVDLLKENITHGLFDNGFVTYESNMRRLNLWSLNDFGEFISKPKYVTYDDEYASIVTIKKFQERSFLFMQHDRKIDVMEITGGKRIRMAGSAENLFSIQSIGASPELDKFYIAQGMYGVSELKLR